MSVTAIALPADVGYQIPGLLEGPPRWSQTCSEGHFTRERSWIRPAKCHCGVRYKPPREYRGSFGRKRISGVDAMVAIGEGLQE